MNQTAIPFADFVPQIPYWHQEYRLNNPKVSALEILIQHRAESEKSLGLESLKKIVMWGGNPHGIWQQIKRKNTEDEVRGFTRAAITVLDEPENALAAVTRVKGLGDSFGSKALGFISPQTCAIWDSVVKACLSSSSNPPRNYNGFIDLLKHAGRLLQGNQHRPDNKWWVRDVEEALFQFAMPKHRGGFGGSINGRLP